VGNIADTLKAELIAAAGDIERGCDRAVDAAINYMVRRLQQLERRFPRHRFVYIHRGGCSGLYLYPQVKMSNSLAGLLTSLCSRSTRWRTMSRLRHVQIELDHLAFRIASDFDQLIGVIESGGQTMPRFIIGGPSHTDAKRKYDDRLCDRQKANERRYNRKISRRVPHAV
jgi:hypothetical protein